MQILVDVLLACALGCAIAALLLPTAALWGLL